MENHIERAVKLRIATYNIGDFSGDGFAAGSPEGIAAIRRVMASAEAALWALQEDVAYCNADAGRQGGSSYQPAF